MKNKKKPILLLLALVMAVGTLLFTACDGAKSNEDRTADKASDTVDTSAETDASTGEPVEIVKDGKAVRIVYSMEHEDDTYAVANSIAQSISNLVDVKPIVVDDVSAGRNGYDNSTVEILVGYTRYDASAQAYAELTDYSQCVIKFVGNKLVIASYDANAISSSVKKLALAFSKGKSNGNITLTNDYQSAYTTDGTLSEAKLPILAGEYPIILDQADGCYEFVFTSADEEMMETYVGQLTEGGYTLYTENQIDDNLYKTYTNSTNVVNVNYVPNMAKLFVIVDSLSKTALPGLESENVYTKDVTTTLFTQLGLYSNGTYNGYSDPTVSTADVNGMGYIMRLEDGSFLVIDGGHGDADDAARILKTLRKQAPDPDRITVAAWIFTHAHGDHTGAFAQFAKTYASTVTVERFIFNFPTSETATAGGGDTRSQVTNAIATTAYAKVPVVKAHFGQVFYIRNAKITMLCNLEMIEPFTMSATDNSYNNTSLIFSIETEGAKIMILGDCYAAEDTALRTAYSAQTLKSDAVQMGHHGIDGIVSDKIYQMIDAKTVFWPAGSYHYAGYVNKETGIVYPKFSAWGVTSTDMRKNPWNKWTQAEGVSVYLAADDMTVAEIKDGMFTVTQYDTADAYFNAQ